MLGMKPDEHIREPMLWDERDRDHGRTHWLTPRFTTDESVMPAALQMGKSDTVFGVYQRLIALKKTAVFSLGTIEKLPCNNEHVIGFRTKLGEASALVYHNLSSQKVTLPMDDEGYRVAFVQGKANVVDKTVVLEARCSLVLTNY